MKREVKEKLTLANLTIGAEAKVVKVLGKTAITRRLMEMGVVPGVSVKVVKTAPFGDPIQIRVLGYSLAMRKSEAEIIEISE
jgi:ferrous iron transport protein A